MREVLSSLFSDEETEAGGWWTAALTIHIGLLLQGQCCKVSGCLLIWRALRFLPGPHQARFWRTLCTIFAMFLFQIKVLGFLSFQNNDLHFFFSPLAMMEALKKLSSEIYHHKILWRERITEIMFWAKISIAVRICRVIYFVFKYWPNF